jgi:hypothetical protein
VDHSSGQVPADAFEWKIIQSCHSAEDEEQRFYLVERQ